VALVDALHVPADALVPRARAVLGRRDESLRLRKLALEGLQAHSVEAGRAASAAIGDDDDPELLLAAAAWLVDHGRADAAPRLTHAIGALAEAGPARRALALGVVNAPTPPRFAAIRACLPELRASPLWEVRVAALRAAVRVEGAAAMPLFLAAAGATNPAEVAAGCDALRALAPLGHPEARATLRAVLVRPHVPLDTVTAATLALARIGIVDDIAPLRAMQQGRWLGAEKSSAVEIAISTIQERIGPADAGRVSLAPNAEGAVSVVASAGAVTVVRDDP
jgi:hypothetical protein